jgi:hypothetical protein
MRILHAMFLAVASVSESVDVMAQAPRREPPVVRVSEQGAVVLGAADDEVDPTNVADAVVLSDGRVVTFSWIGATILVFDVKGKLQRRLGGVGQGPGEFLRPLGLHRWAGDTLLLADGGTRRLTWIHADRGVVRDDACASCFTNQTPALLGVISGERLVMGGTGLVTLPATSESGRSRAPLAVVDLTTRSITVIAELEDLDVVRVETRYRGRPARQVRPLGFTRQAHVVAVGTALITGDGGTTAFEVRSADGTPERALRLPLSPRRPVSASMRAAFVAQQLEQLRAPGREGLVDAAESERLERTRPFADSLPAYGRLLAGPSGTWWIVDTRAPGDSVWGATELDVAGTIRRRVVGRGTGQPIAFGRDRAVVRRESGPDGVELLVVPLP